jgi:hypothetical protein
MTQAMTQKDQYIVMKSSRLAAKGLDNREDVYAGVSCQAASIQVAQVYGSFVTATQDTQVLTKLNPVGFHVWQVGTSQAVG